MKKLSGTPPASLVGMSNPSKGGTVMTKKRALRLISLSMLTAAAIFMGCALSAPNLGSAIYIEPFEFGVEQWQGCYALYVLVMVSLFAASFFVKDRPK